VPRAIAPPHRPAQSAAPQSEHLDPGARPSTWPVRSSLPNHPRLPPLHKSVQIRFEQTRKTPSRVAVSSARSRSRFPHCSPGIHLRTSCERACSGRKQSAAMAPTAGSQVTVQSGLRRKKAAPCRGDHAGNCGSGPVRTMWSRGPNCSRSACLVCGKGVLQRLAVEAIATETGRSSDLRRIRLYITRQIQMNIASRSNPTARLYAGHINICGRRINR